MAGPVKSFQFFQKIHQIIAICPTHPNRDQLSISSKRAIFVIALAQVIVPVVIYLYEAESTYDYGFGFFVLICLITCIAVYLLFIWQLENTVKFIETCEHFIAKSECQLIQSKCTAIDYITLVFPTGVHSIVAYKKSMDQIQLFSQYFYVFMCISFGVLMCTPIIYSLVRYYIFSMGAKSFYLFVPVWCVNSALMDSFNECESVLFNLTRYPFDWKTPSGYLMAALLQCAGCVCVLALLMQFFNLLIGSCWLFVCIARDITKDWAKFNAAVRSTGGNDAKLTKRFCRLVQVYSDAKQ